MKQYSLERFKESKRLKRKFKITLVVMIIAILITIIALYMANSDFRKLIDSLNMIQSFSAKAHPYDNAVIECFFKYLKKEELNRRSFSSIDQLHLSLVKYIDGFYNPIRPHSHNNGLSPNQMESLFFS